jgi:hypothetical protein
MIMPTRLLYPFAATVPGYQTGISIANTGPDTGAITFSFHPQSGPPFNYTVAPGSPGSGYNPVNGLLPSGGTYVVNLSEILQAAARPPSFIGFFYASCNFGGAHGYAQIYSAQNSDGYLAVIL